MPNGLLTRRHLMRGTAVLAVAGWSVGSRAADEGPGKGGRVRVALRAQPRSLNPAFDTTSDTLLIGGKIIEPLAQQAYDQAGTPTALAPLLATDWRGSADGRSVTLTLRPGVTWHDGQPFSSADVAYSALEVWRRRRDPLAVVFEQIEAVDTPDATTAILRFAHPVPFQLFRNAIPAGTAVLPRHLAADAREALVGTGPFRLAAREPDRAIRLERHDGYWDAGRPLLDGIDFEVVADEAALQRALATGEVDIVVWWPAGQAAPLGYRLETKGYEGLVRQMMLAVNHRRPELAKSEVRHALAFAIERQEMARTLFPGQASVATGPVPRLDAQFYETGVPLYPYKPEAAEGLLEQAGLPRRAGGSRLKLDLVVSGEVERAAEVGERIRRDLERVGIEAAPAVLAPDAFRAALDERHAFDLALMAADYPNDPGLGTTALYRSPNAGGYADALMDNMVDAAAATMDALRRSTILQRFQKYAAFQLPLIPLLDVTGATLVAQRVQNAAGGPRWTCSSWSDLGVG